MSALPSPDAVVAPAARRTLIELAVAACTGDESADGYALVPADPAVLGASGASSVVRAARRAGRVYREAGELAADGHGLQTLLLVGLSDDSEAAPCWVVDGWRLLRGAGTGADLRGACLRGAQLRGARLAGADLSDADATGADFEKADLSGADLTGADLSGSILFSASLQGADLTEASLCRADLRHADMRESICVRTAFRGADFWGAYLWNVDVTQAFTEGVELDRADFLNEKIVKES